MQWCVGLVTIAIVGCTRTEYEIRYSLVPAGPHQVFASGYDRTHALVAQAGPVDFAALGGTQVSVGIEIARPAP